MVNAENTQINFFVYKMDDMPENQRNIDEVNVTEFYQRCINNDQFQKKYNCSRIFLDTADANFVRMNEDDFEILIKTPQLMFVSTKLESEFGELKDVELRLNVPRKLE